MGTNFTHFGMSKVFNFAYLGAAVPLAFDSAISNYSLLNSSVNFVFVYTVSQCNEKLALEVFIKLKQEHNVGVVIGPQCSVECLATALLASQWNIPMISHACSSLELSDSSRFNTFLRTTSSSSIGGAVATTVQNFNWTVVALVQAASTPGYLVYDARSIKTACTNYNISIPVLIEVNKLENELEGIFQQIIPKARSE